MSFGIVAFGANLPSGRATAGQAVLSAVGILHAKDDISIARLSRIWTTPAYPPGSGPDFANACAIVDTSLTPQALLQCLHGIEADFGRDRNTGRWSARVLDMDLIAYGDVILPDPAMVWNWIDLDPASQMSSAPDRLILPHPRMQDRAFVLAPFAEIAPRWRHPLTGRTVLQMLSVLGSDPLAGMTPWSAREGGSFS